MAQVLFGEAPLEEEELDPRKAVDQEVVLAPFSSWNSDK
jgi:hypothetical protein